MIFGSSFSIHSVLSCDDVSVNWCYFQLQIPSLLYSTVILCYMYLSNSFFITVSFTDAFLLLMRIRIFTHLADVILFPKEKSVSVMQL